LLRTTLVVEDKEQAAGLRRTQGHFHLVGQALGQRATAAASPARCAIHGAVSAVNKVPA
jgi:hypothetical protein